MYSVWPFCTQGTHMPSSGSFVILYLAELHFGNGYMEIGLLISNLHDISNKSHRNYIELKNKYLANRASNMEIKIEA